MIIRGLSCCGVGEFSGLRGNEPENILIFVHNELRARAHIIFTETHRSKKMEKIVKIIRNKRLGSIKKSRSSLNRNSGNHVTTYVFTPEVEKFHRWGIRTEQKKWDRANKKRRATLKRNRPRRRTRGRDPGAIWI